MESAIGFLVIVAVIIGSVYLANFTRIKTSEKTSRKMNDIFSFLLPFITSLVAGIAVIRGLVYLPVVITLALFAGVLGLLVSWTSEQKSRKDTTGRTPTSCTILIVLRDLKMPLELR